MPASNRNETFPSFSFHLSVSVLAATLGRDGCYSSGSSSIYSKQTNRKCIISCATDDFPAKNTDITKRWEFPKRQTAPAKRFSSWFTAVEVHCGLKTTFVTEPVGHEVFNGATEDTNRQIQLVTVTPSVRLSVFLFVSLLSVSICMWLRITASLSVFPFPSVTLFPLILFSVCGLVCRSLSITPRCSCVCVCECARAYMIFYLFFLKLVSHCLHLSISVPSPAHVSSLLSLPVSLSVCLFRSVCLSVYLDLFGLFFFFFFSPRLCVAVFHVRRHTHTHTPACLPSLGSMGTCKWDKGGENKQIKLQSRLFTLSSFFYEPPQPLTHTHTHTHAHSSSSFSSTPSSPPPLPQHTLAPFAQTQQPVWQGRLVSNTHSHTTSDSRVHTHTHTHTQIEGVGGEGGGGGGRGGSMQKLAQTSAHRDRSMIKLANTRAHAAF